MQKWKIPLCKITMRLYRNITSARLSKNYEIRMRKPFLIQIHECSYNGSKDIRNQRMHAERNFWKKDLAVDWPAHNQAMTYMEQRANFYFLCDPGKSVLNTICTFNGLKKIQMWEYLDYTEYKHTHIREETIYSILTLCKDKYIVYNWLLDMRWNLTH